MEMTEKEIKERIDEILEQEKGLDFTDPIFVELETELIQLEQQLEILINK